MFRPTWGGKPEVEGGLGMASIKDWAACAWPSKAFFSTATLTACALVLLAKALRLLPAISIMITHVLSVLVKVSGRPRPESRLRQIFFLGLGTVKYHQRLTHNQPYRDCQPGKQSDHQMRILYRIARRVFALAMLVQQE